jgi:hypothetical protein
MEAIFAILAVILVVSILSNIVFNLRLKNLKKELYREQSINRLYDRMIAGKADLVSVEMLNFTPLVYLKQTKQTLIRYYLANFNQLNQTKALMFGSYLFEIYNMLKTDRKEYLLDILYEAGESVPLKIWSDLLVQAIILENQLQEEGQLNDIAELIGFIITVSNQGDEGDELIALFEAEVKKVLASTLFNEALKNKIEIAMMRICNSLSVGF